jgi:hypothetical protein
MYQVRCATYVVAWGISRHLLNRLPPRQKRNRRRGRGVSQKRCGMLPARSSNVSRRGVIHHALARHPWRVWRGAKPLRRESGKSHLHLCPHPSTERGILLSPWCRWLRASGRDSSQESAGIHPCRGFGGVPQFPNLPQEWGQGVDR